MELQNKTENFEFRTYKYRWLIVALYGLYAGANLYQINQFTIIENVIEKYYQTTSFLVNLSQLLFMITLVIFIIPAVYLIEKYNLRIVGIVCSGLTFLGALLKLLATSPTSNQFYIILVAQCICGIAQVFMIMLPAKVVAVWCSAEEQNRACGVSLWGGEIGMLIGAVTPILFVRNKNGNEEIENGLWHMLVSNAIFCGLVFTAVLFFFKAKPPLPPSPQQCALINVETNYKSCFKQLLSNNDFIWIIALFGISCGIWSVFGIIENMIYLHYFPDSLSDLAIITSVTTITGGIIGNVAFGYILDKTLKYKIVTFASLLCTSLCYAVLAICLEMRWYFPSYVMMIIFGFFASSSVNISFQYIAEVTYPVSEAITISVLQGAIASITIIYEIIFNILLDGDQYITVHVITVLTLCTITSCTYFLSSKLNRMLVDKQQNISNQ